MYTSLYIDILISSEFHFPLWSIFHKVNFLMYMYVVIKGLSHNHYLQFAHILRIEFGHACTWIYMEKMEVLCEIFKDLTFKSQKYE